MKLLLTETVSLELYATCHHIGASAILRNTMIYKEELINGICVEKLAPKVCIFCDVYIIGTNGN